MAKIKKVNILNGKKLAIRLSKSVKMKTLSALIFKENYYYFLLHLIFFSGTDERGVQPLIMG